MERLLAEFNHTAVLWGYFAQIFILMKNETILYEIHKHDEKCGKSRNIPKFELRQQKENKFIRFKFSCDLWMWFEGVTRDTIKRHLWHWFHDYYYIFFHLCNKTIDLRIIWTIPSETAIKICVIKQLFIPKASNSISTFTYYCLHT